VPNDQTISLGCHGIIRGVLFMEEIWKDIEGHDGYQVSNLGNVKSLDRWIFKIDKRFSKPIKLFQPGIMKAKTKYASKKGLYGFYFTVNLGKIKRIPIHRIVAKTFIDNPLCLNEVNHINSIKTDNRVENLEWVNRRENMAHAYKKRIGKSSKYTGVSFLKRDKKWESYITINSKRINLGYYNLEEDAHNAYQKALKDHNLKNKFF
jgi:hypothetical protein